MAGCVSKVGVVVCMRVLGCECVCMYVGVSFGGCMGEYFGLGVCVCLSL